MRSSVFLLLISLPGLLPAESLIATTSTDEGLNRTWTVTAQAGFASTFQLTLGGMFGKGPAVQDRLSLSVNDAVRPGDSLSFYGWSTTDIPTIQPSWQAGFAYKLPLVRKPHHTLTFAGGMQRWLFPTVKTGAQDWLAAGTLNYRTAVKRVPIVISEDSWSLLRSTLPKGSLLYTQIYTEHRLIKRSRIQLLLRQGPQYTYSWGFYGTQGNRVLRYGGSLVLAWKHTTFEAAYRQQFGLQDGIRDNRYWSFLLTRSMTKPLRFGRSQ